jgi:hypothetical protein
MASTGILTFGSLTVDNAAGLTMAGGTIAGTLVATVPTTLVNSGTTYTVTAGNFAIGDNVTLDQTADIATTGAVTIDTNGQTYILDGTNLTGSDATFNVDALGTLRHTGSTGGVLEPQLVMGASRSTAEDASSGGTGLQFKNQNSGVTHSLNGTLRTTNPNATISLTGPSSPPATGNTYQLVGSLTTDNTAGGIIQMTGPKVALDLNGKTLSIKGTFLWDATDATNPEQIKGSGHIGGPGGGATSTMFINAGGSGGGTFTGVNTVTVDAGTTVDVRMADMTWPGPFTLSVNGTLKLEDVSIRASVTTTILAINSTGNLIHTGSATSTVEPVVNSTGTIEDNSSGFAGVLNLEKATTVTNHLGGTIKTDSVSSTVRLGVDTHQVATSGGSPTTLTIDNTALGAIRIAGNGTVFDLNSSTVTIKGILNWDATATGGNAETMKGFGTFTGPGGGATSILQIMGGGSTGGTFQASKTVTIASGTTVVLFNNGMTWPDNFQLFVMGALNLQDTSINTAWDSDVTPDPANSALLTISSSGNLIHTGIATSTVQPLVNSLGVIEDKSSGMSGLLNIEKLASIRNILGGTVRTDNGSSIVQLGTDVHQVASSGLTMDTTAGGHIQTANNALIALDDGTTGHTLTLKGSSLDLPVGTISANKPATIAGPGTLNLTGGKLALGGPLTVSAPVTQNMVTDVGGFGGELDIGGTWTTNANITDAGNQQTMMKVLAGGALQHTSGAASKVLHPLVIDGLVHDATASGSTPNWTLDSTNSGMNSANTTTVDPGGTVQVDANTLRIVKLSNLSGGTLTNGNYIATGRLRFPGNVTTLNANVTLNGGGLLVNNSNADALTGLTTIGSGASLILTGGHSQPVSSPLTVNGLLGGVGTVTGNVLNQGTVSPGTSPGMLTINGNYSQSPGATLKVAINGTGAGQFSSLQVTNNVSLAGTVLLAPSSGYAASAAPGDSQAFITYAPGANRSGTFGTTTVSPALSGGKPYTVVYDDTNMRVLAVVGQPPTTTTTTTTGTTGTAPPITPPVVVPPTTNPTVISNAFTFGKLKRNKKKGTATLTVNVPGRGTITLSGDGIQTVTQRTDEAGNVTLTIKPNRRTRRKLNRRGRAKITIEATFTPRGGSPKTQPLSFRLLQA